MKPKHPGYPPDMEIWRMFNVDCPPTEGGKQARNYQVGAMEQVAIPLWRFRQAPRRKGRTQTGGTDHIRKGVTKHPPGKNRVEDLAAFYAANLDQKASPFEGVPIAEMLAALLASFPELEQ